MPERYDDRHPGWRIVDSDQTLFEVALIAEQFHRNDYYHNFGHPLNTLLYAEAEIMTYEREEGVSLPRREIYMALLLHDVATNEPLEATPFRTAEHRSAAYAGYILSELGENPAGISDIQSYIISTNPDYDCEDDAAIIVRRADLGNTADNLKTFVKTFGLVYLEQETEKLKHGRYLDALDPVQVAKASSRFLRRYFAQDLTLGSGDWDRTPNGLSSFTVRALANIARLPNRVAGWSYGQLLEQESKN